MEGAGAQAAAEQTARLPAERDTPFDRLLEWAACDGCRRGLRAPAGSRILVRARRGTGEGGVTVGSGQSGRRTGNEEAEDLDGPHLLEVAAVEEVRYVCL